MREVILFIDTTQGLYQVECLLPKLIGGKSAAEAYPATNIMRQNGDFDPARVPPGYEALVISAIAEDVGEDLVPFQYRVLTVPVPGGVYDIKAFDNESAAVEVVVTPREVRRVFKLRPLLDVLGESEEIMHPKEDEDDGDDGDDSDDGDADETNDEGGDVVDEPAIASGGGAHAPLQGSEERSGE